LDGDNFFCGKIAPREQRNPAPGTPTRAQTRPGSPFEVQRQSAEQARRVATARYGPDRAVYAMAYGSEAGRLGGRRQGRPGPSLRPRTCGVKEREVNLRCRRRPPSSLRRVFDPPAELMTFDDLRRDRKIARDPVSILKSHVLHCQLHNYTHGPSTAYAHQYAIPHFSQILRAQLQCPLLAPPNVRSLTPPAADRAD
jgi:hypothetical protein